MKIGNSIKISTNNLKKNKNDQFNIHNNLNNFKNNSDKSNKSSKIHNSVFDIDDGNNSIKSDKSVNSGSQITNNADIDLDQIIKRHYADAIETKDILEDDGTHSSIFNILDKHSKFSSITSNSK